MDSFQAQVQREFDQLRAEITTLKVALAATQAQLASRPRPRLPDPEKFTSSSYKFDTCLPLIRAKLLVNGTAIRDATAQFYYVYLNLESSIQAIVLL
jgi:hypothetical protein